MAVISRVTTWADGQTLTASALNGEFSNILNDYNGGITNANISASAAIAYSKLNLTGNILSADIASAEKTGTGDVVLQTKPTLNGSVQAVTSDTDGATITFNMSESNVHTVTLGGNRTLAVSNVSVGQWFYLRLAQDGTGSRTVTWFSTIKWPNATAPTLTTTASRVDSFAFFCTSSGNYDGYIVGQNLG